MNIFILGATGRVGSRIVALALKERHQVTALVRNTDKLTHSDEKVVLFQGNALDKKDIDRAILGTDVVISALGTDGTTTLSETMPHLIDAMNEEGIKRIITVGTAGILQSRSSPSLLRYQSDESKRKNTFATEEHHRVYELLARSNLDWTIVCPTYLTDGAYTGTYRVERDFLPEGGSEISRWDTAAFTYRQIERTEFIKSRVGIAY